ncbi:glycosyltransferase [Stenotrophomonas maltophilia]|nr:glycosyltransferase [Stenotrophomonas maltophilia]WQI22975.1 glycosyltransferase [Stenotrophomonas maltophilia]
MIDKGVHMTGSPAELDAGRDAAGRCLACVVAFNPDDEFESRLAPIKMQVDKLIVVNNFKAGSVQVKDVEIIENGNRGGIAGALNAATAYARQSGFRYIALFDHDSAVPLGMISRLIDSLCSRGGSVIGPVYDNSATQKAGRFVLNWRGVPLSRWISRDEGVKPAYFVITSGTVIDLERVPCECTHDETLGLDMVDIDYCLSLTDSGGLVLLDTSVRMQHGIGNKAAGSRRMDPPNYSLGRHAGIIRNRVRVWKKWGRRFPLFVLLDLAVTGADFARNVALLPNRGEYAAAFCRSMMAALREAR